MLLRLVPVAILAWVSVGGAVGLVVDLPVLFRVCALIAIAALPLLLLILWLEFASQREKRDEHSSE